MCMLRELEINWGELRAELLGLAHQAIGVYGTFKVTQHATSTAVYTEGPP